MHDVALFPIPNSVNFPGVPCPLHVFEPRYRQMVSHCIDNAMMIGICHTEKVLRSNDKEQTLEEALGSNQSTYKPVDIFSAGPVELLEELSDGRLMIRVDTAMRMRLGQEKQTLPFSIWTCEELLDDPLDEADEAALAQTQAKILRRLLALTHGNDQAQDMLNSEHWQEMPALKFSFAVAGCLAMPPDISQSLLEMTSPQQRLDNVLDMINSLGY
ncbi:MAG: LON peptidase substrate-binding domain-containing protein [Pseudomonadota bacterium]